jgi:hypothetical protein
MPQYSRHGDDTLKWEMLRVNLYLQLTFHKFLKTLRQNK